MAISGEENYPIPMVGETKPWVTWVAGDNFGKITISYLSQGYLGQLMIVLGKLSHIVYFRLHQGYLRQLMVILRRL